MNLYDATKDLHHAVEQTPFGGTVAAGSPSPEQWLFWLRMKDALVEKLVGRSDYLGRLHALYQDDIRAMEGRGVRADAPISMAAFVKHHWEDHEYDGAEYVALGAGLMGAGVIRRNMIAAGSDLPMTHLTVDAWAGDRKVVGRRLIELRERTELTADARATFAAFLESCKEAPK